ncbi:MAG: hypothetical protein AB7H77_12085, partial [Bdellovibrionales bacterium]
MSEGKSSGGFFSSRRRRDDACAQHRTGPPDTRSGFAIGPILYLLGLIGVGAGVLFSGYSQILRSNIQITEDMGAKNDLNAATTTLASTSTLSADSLVFCPPPGPGASVNCNPSATIPEKLLIFASVPAADTGRLPSGYNSAGSGGTPTEVGVFAAGSGLKQIDPYGHFYIYCRWENARSSPSSAAFTIISAGPDGALNSTCGDSTPVGDDLMAPLSVGSAIQRSAIWQTDSSNNVYYGATGTQLRIDTAGNMVVPGSLAVTSTATFTGTGVFTGDVTAPTFNGNVVGATGTFSGGVSAGGGFTGDLSGSVYGGTVSGTTGNFSGNLSTGGTLGVTGDATINGAATIGTTLGVSGDTTLSGALDVSGNSTLGGTLAVTSTATFGTTLGQQVFISPTGAVTANTGFSGNLTGNVSGDVSGSIAGATGAFTSAVSVGGANVSLLASGDGNFSGTLTAGTLSGPFTGVLDLS